MSNHPMSRADRRRIASKHAQLRRKDRPYSAHMQAVLRVESDRAREELRVHLSHAQEFDWSDYEWSDAFDWSDTYE